MQPVAAVESTKRTAHVSAVACVITMPMRALRMFLLFNLEAVFLAFGGVNEAAWLDNHVRTGLGA